MNRIIEFPLEDGGSIFVEIIDHEMEIGMEKVAKKKETISKSKISFEAALDRIKPIANIVINKLREMEKSVDEIEVQFGLKMNAQAGVIFASTGLEANYTIKLKWSNKN